MIARLHVVAAAIVEPMQHSRSKMVAPVPMQLRRPAPKGTKAPAQKRQARIRANLKPAARRAAKTCCRLHKLIRTAEQRVAARIGAPFGPMSASAECILMPGRPDDPSVRCPSLPS